MMDELKSPLGAPFKDLDARFSLLRGNFAEAVNVNRTPLEALRYLHTFTLKKQKQKNFAMHPSIPENEIALKFANAPIDSEEYWQLAFQIIKSSDKFNDMGRMGNALIFFVNDLKENREDASPEKKREILEIATREMKKAFLS
jgi:hypothetical protein